MKEQIALTSFNASWQPFDNRDIYEWAKDHVVLHGAYSIPGNVDIARSKYAVDIFKSLKDLRVRQTNIMGSPRCFKTTIAEIFMLHTIANSSGPFLWLQSSDEMSGKMSEQRMIPLLRGCKPVRDLIDTGDRFAILKSCFKFPHMTVNISSAKIRSLQSLAYKYIIADEVWLWEQGFISEMKTRTIDFQHTCKLILLSQGGTANDDWDKEFNKGIIYEWGYKCASCGTEQVLEFNKKREDGTYSGIVWDKNDTTCLNGIWNYKEAAKTARLECHNPNCKHQYADNPQNRRYLNDHGLYICTNSNGDPKIKSFRYNAMANIEIAFADLVIEYLQAKDALSLEGNKIPLIEFYQKRLAKPWNTAAQVQLAKIMLEDYDPLQNWGDYSFMTIDCQNNFTEFWYVIRSWLKNGESRLRKWGRAPSFAELRKIQQEMGIRDQCVLIDSGNFATQVYAKCVEYSHIGVVGGKKVWLSWIALKGWDSIDFQHTDGPRKLYSPETRGDPNLGKEAQGRTCPLYKWSNYSIKNILSHLRDSKGAKWTVPEFDEEYERQMNSEILTRTIDKKTNREKWIWVAKTGVPNHYWDCENMQVVAACMVGILGNIQQKQ